MLDHRHILLGVTGGVAAYKAVDLAGKLTAVGAEVRTVMTESACRFVGPKSFEAVTQSTVFTTMWSTPQEFKIGHIALADWADLVVVAPATANIIAKVAHGICDDLLSTTLCVCWATPTLFAPAMNNRMWENPATQANVETLKNRGFHIVGPEEGRLACGDSGPGRMSEPQDIMNAIEKIASNIEQA
ncbi:MAG: bifunctional phosphopantothenoylcysteine decarboxylase/phosphopantothenate--cysteine ligase CoaBC [Sedimentisphaerales bacterium]|nr:bifunctional phosphopantothenoylcysteine decarboxylase/phosphopantothenate--cysteine ligase CoaBC [Sedimentisphaerales bacterium]